MADPQRAGPVPAGPSGYVIRPPQQSTPPAVTAPSPQAAPPTAAPATTTAAPVVAVREPALVGGLTQNGAIIGAAVMLAAAVVIFLLRGALRSHLIANRSSLSGANGAAWALFAFLFCLVFTVVFGLLGQLWTVLSFIIPLGVMCLATLILFVLLYNSATRISR